MAGDRRPSIAVVLAVADELAVAPERLDPPLGAVIDPVALDALVGPDARGAAPDRRISFEYCSFQITVTGDGTVELDSTRREDSVSPDCRSE